MRRRGGEMGNTWVDRLVGFCSSSSSSVKRTWASRQADFGRAGWL